MDLKNKVLIISILAIIAVSFIIITTIRIYNESENINEKDIYTRGDIINFEAPTFSGSKSSLALNNNILTQRIIGLSNDHVTIYDGKVYVNGELLDEPYLGKDIITKAKYYSDLIVPDGYLFVMGDDRANCTDSRDFGCIPIDKII